jgi:hypothetical protein
MFDWQKILTESQIPIILLAISYFVKRHYDLKTKKVEINHSLFQQNKINSTGTFFLNYAKAESMWNELSHWDILDHKVSSKEIDKIIGPPMDDLKRSVLELKIYFTKKEHAEFESLLSNFQLVNNNLSQNYFDYDTEKTIIQKTNSFLFFKEKKVKENNKILDSLTDRIRDSFID